MLSTSSEIQAKLSARYCRKYLVHKNIADLSSADDENKNYADYFIEELNQLGIDPNFYTMVLWKKLNFNKQRIYCIRTILSF